MPMAMPISTREPKRTVNQSAATPLKRTVAAESTNQKPRSKIGKQYEQIKKFMGTVKFGNDQIAPILGYGDLVQGNKSTCYIHDLKGNDLLIGSHGTDVYSITLQYTSTPNPICLMAKATSSQAWLWHRCLSHLNFDTINLLSKYDIVIGLPKLKFIKDHLCPSCELGKAKCKSLKTKTTPSSKRRLQILHMDLCGPMRVESFNGPSGELDGTPTLPDGQDTTKTVETNLNRNLRTVLGQQINGACSPNFWSIDTEKITYLDRGSLKLQCANWILPYRFLGPGFKDWLDARHHELTPPIGTNLIATLV
ncbi:retrovirus-related pol polyprotein from transposon TNT 1-94 [Tanacetum coccineum]